MRNLAQKTGGRHYQVENISNLAETFAQVAKELGQQYSLGYYPKQSGKKGERRQIKVKVKIPNMAVRARDSYIVGTSKNKQ
jgi:VWFA-related protein